MAFKLAEAFVELKSKGLHGVNRDFDKASGSLKQLAGQFGNTDRLLSVARTGALAFGAALVAATGRGIQLASSLETSLANVATISDDVRANMGRVSKALQQMSIDANTDPRLLSEGLYQTISADITDTGDALKFLQTSAIAARGGLTDTATAVDGLSSVINAFGLEASAASTVSSKFFVAVEKGKLTFGDIARSIGNVSPLASQLGVSFDDLLATTSALTTVGLSFSEAVTGVRGILTAVLRPTNQAQTAAANLGLEFNAQALEAKGLVGFLKGLGTATRGNSDAMAQLFGDVEGLNAALALTGKLLSKTTEIQKDLAGATTEASDAFKIQNETFGAQASLFGQNLNRVLTDLGKSILPSVTSALKAMNEEMAKNAKLSEERRARGDFPSAASQSLPLTGRLLPSPRPEGLLPGLIREQEEREYAMNFGVRRPRPQARDAIGLRSLTRGLIPTPRNRLTLGAGQSLALPGQSPIGRIPALGAESQRLTEQQLQSQGRTMERNLDLFRQFQLENPFATPAEELERLNLLMGDLTESLQRGSDAWFQYKDVAVPIEREIQREAKRATANIADIVSKNAKRNVLGGFTALKKGAKSFTDNFITGIEKQGSTFSKFRAEIESRETQFNAQVLAESGNRVQSQLLLLETELGQRKRIIDRDVENTVTAERLKASLTAQIERERTRIIETEQKRRARSVALDLQSVRVGADISQSPFPTGATPTGVGMLSTESAKAASFLSRFGREISRHGQGIAKSFREIDFAIQGGKAGGAAGAIGGFVSALALRTEGFGRVMDSLDRLFGDLATALEPTLNALADTLEPLLKGLGDFLSALQPIFSGFGKAVSVLTAPLRLFGDGLSAAGRGLADLLGVAQDQRARRDVADQRIARNEARQQAVGGGRAVGNRQDARVQPAAGRGDGRFDIRARGADRQAAAIAPEVGADENPDVARRRRVRGIPLADAQAQQERERGERATGGIQLSAITGPTRDILVSLLKPLDQLNTTFPAMLDELKGIRFELSTRAETPRVIAPHAAPMQNRNGDGVAGQAQLNPAEAELAEVQILGDLVIQVEQLADVNPREINRQLHQQLRADRRKLGNRGRVANLR